MFVSFFSLRVDVHAHGSSPRRSSPRRRDARADEHPAALLELASASRSSALRQASITGRRVRSFRARLVASCRVQRRCRGLGEELRGNR